MNDFNLLIIKWYRQNKRNLPWRLTKNPYMIWLSEIILQQTKVDQGLNYYLKFRTNYPTIDDLAKADEQKVLSDWQGLGYYSRARNLHTTAKTIIDTYQGIFPNTYENILKLKGIGTYTAAAISSSRSSSRNPSQLTHSTSAAGRLMRVPLPIRFLSILALVLPRFKESINPS